MLGGNREFGIRLRLWKLVAPSVVVCSISVFDDDDDDDDDVVVVDVFDCSLLVLIPIPL